MRQFVLFWASSWVVLSFLFLPFSFSFLPNIGIGLSQLILPINTLICSWFGTTIRESFLVSDSLAFYSTGMLLFLLSGIITCFVYLKGRYLLPTIQTVFLYMLIILLAYFLIRYGLDKLVGRQFYTPASNTLHTPAGQLGKDLLFWTTMGTSSFYNTCMGVAEVIAGLLILFNRTRFFGLLVSLGIVLNILAINIGFDITVKYLSGLLLMTCLICLCFYHSKLRLLFKGKQTGTSDLLLPQRWVIALFIPFLIDLGVAYRENPPRNSGRSFLVEAVNGSSQLMDIQGIIRIHIHPKGYFITENKQQVFTSYRMDKQPDVVIINNRSIPISIRKDQLVWTEAQNEVVWNLKEIDLTQLELKQDETHWYVEKFVFK